MLQTGQVHSETVSITPQMVQEFAEVSGDFNPLHLDPVYAARTPFGKPIAHGMLSGALISGAIGTRFPGPGTILMQMDFKFMRPVFVGETVTLRFRVESVREDKPIVVLHYTVENSQNEVAAEGRTTIKVPRP